jgi:hypothetical protein
MKEDDMVEMRKTHEDVAPIISRANVIGLAVEDITELRCLIGDMVRKCL